MRRILCLRLRNWPIARRLVERPELEGQPLALYARDARGREAIAACAPAAAARGVRIGMPKVEAGALGAGIVLESDDPAADRAALERLAGWCERWSPLVGLENADPPSCLLLDLTGLAALFGGEERLVKLVREGVARQGYPAFAVVAETVGAAWARAWRQEFGPPDRRGAALEELPLAALRLPPATLALLDELGWETIGQLLALPRAALAARFGAGSGLAAGPESLLLHRLDQLTGLVPEIIRPYRAPRAWQVRWSLEHPTARRDILEAVCDQLLAQLIQQLDEGQRVAARLTCRLEVAAQTAIELPINLHRPTAVASHLLQMVRLRLERLTIPGPVCGITLHAVETVACGERQLELFSREAQPDDRQLAWLLDRLRGRFGEQAVVRPQARGDPLPERAVRYPPPGPAARPARSKRRPRTLPAAATPGRLAAFGPLQRPVWLFAPQAVDVVAVAPDGPPLCFTWQGTVHKIARPWGPERIESGWWRGRRVARDYYRVETEAGNRYWLFRSLRDGRWWLQGIFA